MMSSEDSNELLWEQFNQLIAIAKSNQKDIFNSTNLEILRSFVQSEMVNPQLPSIESLEQFSEVILTLKTNYSQWNQRVTFLLIELKSEDTPSLRKEIDDFFKTCPWRLLIDVMHNVLEKD